LVVIEYFNLPIFLLHHSTVFLIKSKDKVGSPAAKNAITPLFLKFGFNFNIPFKKFFMFSLLSVVLL